MTIIEKIPNPRSYKSTNRRWVLFSGLAISALIVTVTSIYFLFLPSGFQGGRNPYYGYYGVDLIFSRSVWDLIHTWSGIGMIVVALVHIIIHWQWFTRMIKRSWQQLTGKTGPLNNKGTKNLWANFTIAISFFFCSISGVYFLFVPGNRNSFDPMLLFSRTVWDLIHTWTGIVVILAAIVHIAIHWNWITNHTNRIFRSGWNYLSAMTLSAGKSKAKA